MLNAVIRLHYLQQIVSVTFKDAVVLQLLLLLNLKAKMSLHAAMRTHLLRVGEQL